MASRWIVGALAALLLGGVAAGPARAQDNQVNALAQQIQRLRDDLSLMQRDYYQGRTPPALPPTATLTPATPAINTQAANQMDTRLAGLEDELRTLVGTFERIERGMVENRARLEKIEGDVTFRLNTIEQRLNNQQTAAAPTITAPAAAPAATPRPATAAAAPTVVEARPPGTQVLGTLTPEQARAPAPAPTPAAAAPAPQAAAAPATALPRGTVKQQYDYAYGLLQQFRIPEAERAFTEFLVQHGADDLSNNARYWLGETYYARAQYQQAAVTFFDGYQKAPQGPKAADNLLKLGMSLGRMGQKQEACATLAELNQRFPTATASIREQASAERRRLACA